MPKFGPWIDISGWSTVEQQECAAIGRHLQPTRRPDPSSNARCGETSAELVSDARIWPSVP